MTAQNIGVIKSDAFQISSESGEDKKFVSQAVAFVIGHARNGFVALCASVASVLKEQARLKQEVESLQKEISILKQRTEKIHCQPSNFVRKEISVSLKSQNSVKLEPHSSAEIYVKNDKESALDRKHLKTLHYRKLDGCICKQCIESTNHKPLEVPINKGMKVVLRGDICGVVHYTGHVESLEFPEIYVGVELSEAVGNSDGSIGNKVYFSVPKNYGIFVPLSHVCCAVRDYAKPKSYECDMYK